MGAKFIAIALNFAPLYPNSTCLSIPRSSIPHGVDFSIPYGMGLIPTPMLSLFRC